MGDMIDRLAQGQVPDKAGLAELLGRHRDPELRARLAALALAAREEHFGRDVYLRGLIEFTSYCRNDCLYCGLRRGNPAADRYRLSAEEIVDRCRVGRDLGFRTFVLQGGEDPETTDDWMVGLVITLRREFPDCAITLSAGEKSRESYEALRQAGADRYLLRHETANAGHYSRLHPPSMTLAGRLACLEDLRAIGFQVGAGFMVGSPWQTYEHLAEDLLFLRDFRPQMVGIGPFIPHPQTPLAGFSAGDAALTTFILGLVRLILPRVLLPATTALGTILAEGREMALEFGANVMMPNLSPLEVRSKYEIYTGKIHLDEEAAEGLARLRARLAALGYKTPEVRGDFPDAV